MRFRFVSLALVGSALTVSAFAQANSFALINKAGRTVGKASYSVDKTKDGYKVKTRYEYRTGITDNGSMDPDKQGAGGIVTDAQMNAEYKTDANGNFLSGFTQNGTNQTITSLTPSKPRDSVVIGQMQGGVNLGSKSLPVPKPDFFLAADYDPSAMQVLLNTVINHPHTDHTYLFVLPGAGAGPRAFNTAAYMTVSDPTDAAGTLDGKPVTLKHYALAWSKAKGDLWADTDGNLMQVNVGTINVTYIRNKFVLADKPAK